MKLKEAIEIGKTCGLHSIEESINNIIIHSTMLFPYNSINKELTELKTEAKAIGIEFCDKGHAKINGSCYICRNL